MEGADRGAGRGAVRHTPARVVHVVERGDTSGLFRGFARYHNRCRWQPDFVTLGVPDGQFRRDLAAMGVEVSGLEAVTRRDLPGVSIRFARWLARCRPRVVHAHLFEPALVAMTAACLARIRVRVVTRHHSDYHTRTGRWLPVALDRYTTFLAHRVVAVSRHVRRTMLEEEGADPDRVVTIPNGIDEERFVRVDSGDAKTLRERLSDPGEAVVVHPARLHPEKGQDVLFRAVDRLVRGGWNLRLWVAGDGPYRRRYEEMVAGLGLSSRVDFLGFRDDVASLMKASDVVVVPSRAEAFGLVVLEARALGRAVVATRVGAIPELLEGGEAGWLVAPGDEVALAEGLGQILARPELRRFLEERGGGQVLQRWSLRGMVEEYEALYEAVFKERTWK